MADIINLSQARKARARAAAEVAANERRALHGRTKADRQAAAKEAERQDRHLDGARREGEQD